MLKNKKMHYEQEARTEPYGILLLKFLLLTVQNSCTKNKKSRLSQPTYISRKIRDQ